MILGPKTAMVLAADTPAALGAVDSLVDASLLQASTIAGDHSRYTMLETIREYAMERLAAAGETEEAQMTLYEFLKYIHVVLAIVAIGFNISYAIWLQRAAKDPALRVRDPWNAPPVSGG